MTIVAILNLVTSALLVVMLARLTHATAHLRDSVQRYVDAVRDHNRIQLLDPPPMMQVYAFVAFGFVTGFLLARALP